MQTVRFRADLHDLRMRIGFYAASILRAIIYSESLTAEWIAGFLAIVLGLVILNPSSSVVGSNAIYAPLLQIPFGPEAIEIVWGAVFVIVGGLSVAGIILANHALRIIGTGLSFTVWMFMFALTLIGNSHGLGWAYNLFFAVGQLITFVQLSAKQARTVIHE